MLTTMVIIFNWEIVNHTLIHSGTHVLRHNQLIINAAIIRLPSFSQRFRHPELLINISIVRLYGDLLIFLLRLLQHYLLMLQSVCEELSAACWQRDTKSLILIIDDCCLQAVWAHSGNVGASWKEGASHDRAEQVHVRVVVGCQDRRGSLLLTWLDWGGCLRLDCGWRGLLLLRGTWRCSLDVFWTTRRFTNYYMRHLAGPHFISHHHSRLTGEYGPEPGARLLIHRLLLIIERPAPLGVIDPLSSKGLQLLLIEGQMAILVESVDVSVSEEPLMVVEIVREMILEQYLGVDFFRGLLKHTVAAWAARCKAIQVLSLLQGLNNDSIVHQLPTVYYRAMWEQQTPLELVIIALVFSYNGAYRRILPIIYRVLLLEDYRLNHLSSVIILCVPGACSCALKLMYPQHIVVISPTVSLRRAVNNHHHIIGIVIVKKSVVVFGSTPWTTQIL